MKKELGIRKPERISTLNESLNLPSLNINGIQSAAVGNLSANVIPTKAVASIDLRLVVGNDWKKQQQKVIAHIQSKGYYVVYSEPTDDERMQHDKNLYGAFIKRLQCPENSHGTCICKEGGECRKSSNWL